jgi:hypothetical protein
MGSALLVQDNHFEGFWPRPRLATLPFCQPGKVLIGVIIALVLCCLDLATLWPTLIATNETMDLMGVVSVGHSFRAFLMSVYGTVTHIGLV